MRRFLLVIGALVSLPAYADGADDIARLREEAAVLRQSLDKLEAEIRALEGARPEAQARAEPSLVSVHRSWSGIHRGLSKERVSEVLGAPGSVLHINGDLVWYYVYPGMGKGSVFFDREDKVTAVQAPNFGLF
jgi:hypothetical protein